MIDDSAVGAPLRDKRVLITGASRGIGAATARTVHRDGGTVVVHYGANKAAADALLQNSVASGCIWCRAI